MIFSIAIILLSGIIAGRLAEKAGLPSLLGMILAGIAIGPFCLNIVDSRLLDISRQLRTIALIIILARAGLSLDMKVLRRLGRPALLMCFLPACTEIAAMALLAPIFFDISALDGAIIGTITAAVSPAVIVPKMIKLNSEGAGVQKGIPQLILAGASVDDVIVIVLFSAFASLSAGGSFSLSRFARIPPAIFIGLLAGLAAGYIIGRCLTFFTLNKPVQIILPLCAAFILYSAEDFLSAFIPFSGLIAVMAMGLVLQKSRPEKLPLLSGAWADIWALAQIVLFVLVGTAVNLPYAMGAGISAVVLILLILPIRCIGVQACLVGTDLNFKERLFVSLAYLPKATVQAAMSAVPLAMGLSCGSLALTMAVLAILITAPLGAFLIDKFYKKLLY